MATSLRWTSADLHALPDDGKRYEIVSGELYTSDPHTLMHQRVCGNVFVALDRWVDTIGSGYANVAPGLVFDPENDVVPDVVWISDERFSTALNCNGHLRVAPDLIGEVVLPNGVDVTFNREAKLKLYSQRGVQEYWIVDWRRRQIEVYRREQAALRLVATLFDQDTLQSPLLPGFTCVIERLFPQP